MRWTRGLVLSCAITTAGAVALAPARAIAAPTQEEISLSLQKFEEGRKAFEEKQYDAALAAFQASLELQPSPNSRLYIARCHAALGRVASAYTGFKLAAREAQDRLTASGEKRFSATRDSANDEAAEIEPRVPHLTIAVPSDLPAGFEVKLDGKALQKVAWGTSAAIDPGIHAIEATGPRLEPFREKLEIKEGETKRVDVAPKRLPTATVTLSLVSLPGGVALQLDGAPLDLAEAMKKREVDVGAHKLVAAAPGYLPFTWQKTLADKEDAVVRVDLQPEPRAAAPGGSGGTPPWLFFTAAGASVVCLGVGTGLAIDADSRADSEKAKDTLLRDADEKSSIGSQANVANALFLGGAIFGVGAAVLFFTTSWKSPQKVGLLTGRIRF